MKKIIFVVGRRWFDRRAGNTYHSVAVWVNGEFIGGNEFTYGYDDAYKQTAKEILGGIYPEYAAAGVLWRLAEENGDKIVFTVADVAAKRDL